MSNFLRILGGGTMHKRFSIFAKLNDGRYYYLNFDDEKILDCLRQIPPSNGLLAIANWPLNTQAEIEFFVELINGNIEYYHIKDRKRNIKEKIICDYNKHDK